MLRASESLSAVLEDVEDAGWKGYYADVVFAAAAAKQALRDGFGQTFRGARLPYLVKDYVYGGDSGDPLDLVAEVRAASPRWGGILAAITEGATIQSPNGAWLAIPTAAVPRHGGRSGKRMTPVEVEAHYNRELIYRPARGGNAGLLVLDLTRGKGGRGWRPDTARRRAQGRTAQPVVMFVLVKSASLPRRLDGAALVGAVWGG